MRKILKSSLPLILLTFTLPLLSGVGFDIGGSTEWDKLPGNIEVSLTSDRDIAYIFSSKKTGYPVLTMTLTYTGSQPCTIPWDDDLGRILWAGNFTMETAYGMDQKSSTGLKFKTSNTYEPRDVLTLKKGDTIKASMDFMTLPSKFLQSLVDEYAAGEDVEFSVYVYNRIEDSWEWTGGSVVVPVR